MKKLFTFLFAFIFTLSLGLAAYAKEMKSEDTSKKEGVTKSEDTSKSGGMTSNETSKQGKFVTHAGTFTFKAKDIIGAKVEDPQGKSLGSISDLGVDPKTDRVAFAVIGHSGKDIAVPLKALSLRTDEKGKIKMFVLNMSEDRFANAPKFDKNSWPDKRSTEESYRYFGQHPYWGSERGATRTDHMKSDHMKSDQTRSSQSY